MTKEVVVVQQDVVEQMRQHDPHLEPGTVWVETADGIVKLVGRVPLRSTAESAKCLVDRVPGVVGVIDELTYDLDDRRDVGSETVGSAPP